MRVNQSKLRKEKFPEPPTDSLPRERSDVPNDLRNQDHLAPSTYWIIPQHTTVDVLELSDELCAFSAVCNQYGLRTGECMSLKEKNRNPLITPWHGTRFRQ